MSKPIEYIEEKETEEDSLIPDEYRESLGSFLKTIKNLNDSGFLTLINAMAANYKFIMDTFSDQFNSDTTKKSITNIMSIFDLLSKLDPDVTVNLMNRLGDSINSAGKLQDKGLMDIMRMLNDKTVAGYITLILKILSGLQEKK
ncbi:MAG: hypothetical protein RE471_08485 [Ferroplasma sp.]|uniref:DUF1641 domain-containing protein n=1 Tax=Ferroplasma sp. TaxID=2591003 RepID=UPI00281609A5|nr:hypothetical protein [Ferroplasma sp.]WMT51002.1 MAG: hypothetical protein RE471_08485 [Ferroplasma sp.]